MLVVPASGIGSGEGGGAADEFRAEMGITRLRFLATLFNKQVGLAGKAPRVFLRRPGRNNRRPPSAQTRRAFFCGEQRWLNRWRRFCQVSRLAEPNRISRLLQRPVTWWHMFDSGALRGLDMMAFQINSLQGMR
jgi:hypothetical protein